MGINVKRQDVVENVYALASELGLGITETIDAAVTAKRDQLEGERAADVKRRLKALRAIQAEVVNLVQPGTTSDHSEFYDENGLPV